MKLNFFFVLAAIISLLPKDVFSQTATNTVQPTIMVVPFCKEGEDIRQVLEGDVNKRIALTAVKDAFDTNGYSTVDFLAKLKSVSENTAFKEGSQ